VPPPSVPLGAARLQAVNALRGTAGLPALSKLEEAWSPFRTLVTTIAELDPAAAHAGADTHYVGPLAEADGSDDWSPPADERPLVLVSFSTTSYWDQRGRVRNTLSALAELPVRVLVCGREAEELGALPANAVARRFVPHARVMPSARLAVVHCGHGTVCAALRHGVPILGLPNPAADQPFLAERVQQLGAALRLDGDASAAEIRAAAERLLAAPSFAEAAARLGAAIAAAPGVAGAAARVEELAELRIRRVDGKMG
jgi:MGT family glycosyltransferase